ncbi:hypothetical protein CHELA20_52248 [Hyphomicrobiales bacterium]|nr:hypothetical protein CHELA41_22671 [Hyphomicrobiales bacterium]CAH1681309.1 hypothetical protein CHELA20_52248 [Hyphomicrobiales bacterium]
MCMLLSISCTRKRCRLTHIHAHDTPRRMGRKKLWAERVHVTLAEGVKDRIKAALEPGEDSLDLIRDAIERELRRRDRAKKPDAVPTRNT